ncbi:MAG TPA: hypothetical protein VN081_00885 [Dongiaceae bacterium]|nr:hypothetical protein [Dongiaceae bacterium]
MTAASTSTQADLDIAPDLSEEESEKPEIIIVISEKLGTFQAVRFTTIDERQVIALEFEEPIVHPATEPDKPDAYSVRCRPMGKKKFKAYWIDAHTYGTLELIKLNHGADDLG